MILSLKIWLAILVTTFAINLIGGHLSSNVKSKTTKKVVASTMPKPLKLKRAA